MKTSHFVPQISTMFVNYNLNKAGGKGISLSNKLRPIFPIWYSYSGSNLIFKPTLNAYNTLN